MEELMELMWKECAGDHNRDAFEVEFSTELQERIQNAHADGTLDPHVLNETLLWSAIAKYEGNLEEAMKHLHAIQNMMEKAGWKPEDITQESLGDALKSRALQVLPRGPDGQMVISVSFKLIIESEHSLETLQKCALYWILYLARKGQARQHGCVTFWDLSGVTFRFLRKLPKADKERGKLFDNTSIVDFHKAYLVSVPWWLRVILWFVPKRHLHKVQKVNKKNLDKIIDLDMVTPELGGSLAFDPFQATRSLSCL